MVLIIYAHPYPQRSFVNKALLNSVGDLEQVKIHSLYDLYPDFNIDVLIEQCAVNEATTLIIQHPMQWYNMPPLLKLWIDKVFEYGWAYGHDGVALHGKNLLWVVTTGGDQTHFSRGDFAGFDSLSQPLQKTALYCGMNWLPPFVLHDTFSFDDEQLALKTAEYRRHLINSCRVQPKTDRIESHDGRE
jgi:glutathione-regulated potassium-efflux system ancillary protein KefF